MSTTPALEMLDFAGIEESDAQRVRAAIKRGDNFQGRIPSDALDSIVSGNKLRDEAFMMLTMEPGPNIEPYHDRQIVILDRSSWVDSFDRSVSSEALIKHLPAGELTAEQVG